MTVVDDLVTASALAVGVVGLVLAATVFLVDPRKRANRSLAAFLAVLAAGWLLSNLRPFPMPDAWARLRETAVAAFDVPALEYLLFIGAAIDAPITRPFRASAARWALVALSVGLIVLPFVAPRVFFVSGDELRWSPTLRGLDAASYLPFFYGLAAAFVALRRSAPATLGRRRAWAYFAAFGTQDAFLVGGFVWFYVLSVPTSGYVGLAENIGELVSLALLFVALVRYQIFDFDLKVKWTLRRGTVVAAFIGVFLVAAEVAQNFLTGAFGWLAGGAAAGLLLLALRPMERVADALADRTMPRTQDTPAYVQFRKLEVYKAAVESAHETGGVTEKERAALAKLRAKLGIAESDARAVERDIGERAAAN